VNALVLMLMFSLDGGTPPSPPRPPPVEADQEVIENLELLQNLDGAVDLELLEELSLER
jgi:hypothetical protein